MSLAKIRFVDPNKSQFFFSVKQNVDDYFKLNNLSKNANAAMIFKSIFFFGGVWVLYGLILSNQFTPLTMLFLAMLLGMFKAFVGFNISHDAIHGSYSSNALVNKILGYSFSVLGANQSVWIQSHNIVHHTYTNIPEHDEDLIVAPGLLRLTEGDKKTKIQKFQHLYGFFLYSFASISWVFRKDFIKFFQKKIGQTENRFSARDTFELFFFKLIYVIIFIVVPLLVLKDVTVLQFILGFLAMHFMMGLTLGLVFQLAHVVEQTEYPTPTEIGHIEEAWAVHQMKTTANFGVGSWLTTFLCGGLNHQVEHHLFPKICHIHYPAISKIVRETAEAHDVPYIENKTFFTALKSHYNILKKYSLEV